MRKSVDFNVELPIRVSDDDAVLLARSRDFKNLSCPCKTHGDLLVNGRHEIVLKTLQPGDVLTMVIPPSGEHETRDSK